MTAKIVLGMGYLFAVEQTQVAETTVGKPVNHGTPQRTCQIIVDQRADVGPQSGKHYNEKDVHAVTFSTGQPGCRRHHHFGGKGNERTLNGHEKRNGEIVQIV